MLKIGKEIIFERGEKRGVVSSWILDHFFSTFLKQVTTKHKVKYTQVKQKKIIRLKYSASNEKGEEG